MKKRTRPYFLNQDGTTKHWARFDGVYRTSNLQQMWCVVDRPSDEQYVVLHMDARDMYKPRAITTVPYGTNGFAIACEIAQRKANMASRQDAAERTEGESHESSRSGRTSVPV